MGLLGHRETSCLAWVEPHDRETVGGPRVVLQPSPAFLWRSPPLPRERFSPRADNGLPTSRGNASSPPEAGLDRGTSKTSRRVDSGPTGVARGTAGVHPFRSIADRVASEFKLREIHERIRERFAVPLCFHQKVRASGRGFPRKAQNIQRAGARPRTSRR